MLNEREIRDLVECAEDLLLARLYQLGLDMDSERCGDTVEIRKEELVQALLRATGRLGTHNDG